jgi:hypothetical protein
MGSGGREPCGLERVHGTAFRGSSPHPSFGYGGSFVSSIGCMGLLSAVPPLILHQFKRERALWAQEGVWEHFLWYLPSSLGRLWRELCELNRVHGIAFRSSSPCPPSVREGALWAQEGAWDRFPRFLPLSSISLGGSLVDSRRCMGMLSAVPHLTLD